MKRKNYILKTVLILMTINFLYGCSKSEESLQNKAIKKLEKEIKKNPDFPDSYYNLGCLYVKKGLNDQAMEKFKETIKMDANYTNAHFSLGELYLRKGLTDQAMKSFGQAVTLNPNFGSPLQGFSIFLQHP